MISATLQIDHPLGAKTTVLDFYERDYKPRFLMQKPRKVVNQYDCTIGRLLMARLHSREPILADLSDQTIDRLMGWMDAKGYSIATLESTRWRLRAILRYAASRIEGIEPPLTSRPINAEPARINVAGPAEAHRRMLQSEGDTPKRGRPFKKNATDWLRKLGRIEGAQLPPFARPTEDGKFPDNTVSQLLAEYLSFAANYYHDSREGENMAAALQCLETLFGDEPAQRFSVRKLRAVQAAMIDGYTRRDGKHLPGLSRKEINHRINRIKRVFRWAISEELLPPEVLHSLDAVLPLRKFRTTARELDPVEPVDESVVMATIPHLPPVVADMVRVQLLSGARPGEICIMKPGEIDRSGLVWIYRPSKHKTAYQGRGRQIPLGPEAQKILAQYLERDPGYHCFVPRDSVHWQRARARAARKSKVQPSQVDRSKPEATLRPGLFYTTGNYAQAVRRACHAAGIKAWSPNRLRHTAATKIRKEFGLEAAQAVLGHARADVTQIYAERNMELAWQVVNKIG